MADIVNRYLKILFVTVVFCHMTLSVRSELLTGDNSAGDWSDVLADDAAISPDISSERRTKYERSVGIDTGEKKPKTLNTQISRSKYLPSRPVSASNRGPRLGEGQSSARKAAVIPTVSTLTDDSSLTKKGSGGRITDLPPKPVLSDPRETLVTVNGPPVALTNTDPCDPDPCKNGGTCRRDQLQNMAYQCACPLQYRGKYCHEVMTRCDVIGCRAVTDCISTPAGAVCLCKGTQEGRLCQLDVSNQTEWEKMKMVVSERTVYTGEIVIGSVLGILVLLAVVLAIHCNRVNSRRDIMRKSYKEALDNGIVPVEPPPDWCDISNDIIKQTLCCKKESSLVADYQPCKKLSKAQSLSKQREDELVRLLNSRTSLPNSRTSLPNSRTGLPNSRTSLPNSRTGLPNSRTILPNSRTILPNSRTSLPPPAPWINDLENRPQSYSLLHEIDEALKANEEPHVSPEQIDYEINRRTSSLRSMGLNRPPSRNQSLNNKYLPTPQSRSGHYRSRESLIRQLSRPTDANSRRHIVIRPSQTHSKEKYSFVEEMQKNASQQTFNGRSRKSLVNADKPQQYDMSDGGDDQTSEPVYGSISKYINNSARRSHSSFDKSHHAYIYGNNHERANTGIQFESEQRSYDREDLERRMGDIKDNLEILKSSISQRWNNTGKQKTNRCSQARGRSKRLGQVRYAPRGTRREPAMVSSNSEEETEVSDKVLVVNMEKDVYGRAQGENRFLAYNKNSNTNTNYDHNEMFPSEMCYTYLNHFDKPEKGYCPYSCLSTDKPEDFHPEPVNSHLYRENFQRTHRYLKQIPTNSQGSLKFDNQEQSNHKFETTRGTLDYEDKNSSNKYVDENILAHSDGTAGDIEQQKIAELRTVYTYKHEMQNNMNRQTDRESNKFQESHVDSEKARCFRPGESEYYRILATTVTSSPCTDHTQLMYTQEINDSSNSAVGNAGQPNIDSGGTPGRGQFKEQQHVNSFGNNDRRVYYMSSDLESYTVYDRQLPPDSQLPHEDSRDASRNEHTNIENYEYTCSGSNVLETDEMRQENKSAVLEDTPRTLIDTSISNDRSNVEESTLLAGSNDSDADNEC